MMSKHELQRTLSDLSLSVGELSMLLGVSDRSVRRWLEGEGVPSPVEAALRAWLRLESWGVPWRPDTVSLIENHREQIALMRDHAINVGQAAARVADRGGPKNPWVVDFAKGLATFGPLRVAFYHLANGGFSVKSYSRRDVDPDVQRDHELIDEAVYWILEGYTRHQEQAEALRGLAQYVDEHAHFHMRNGPVLPSSEEQAQRIHEIKKVAQKLELLATEAEDHRGSYQAFESLLEDLHRLGSFPRLEDVSTVARAFHPRSLLASDPTRK